MKVLIRKAAALLLLLPLAGAGQENTAKSPQEILTASLLKVAAVVEPPAGTPAQTFTAHLSLTKAGGLPKELMGRTLEIACQAPDRLRLAAAIDQDHYRLGRRGQELWIYAPAKHFGLIGQPNLPRFSTAPEKKDTTRLGSFKLPLPKEQLALLPLLFNVEARPDESVEQQRCHVLLATPLPQAAELLKIKAGRLQLWIRVADNFPARLAYTDAKGTEVRLEVQEPTLSEAWPADRWELHAASGDKVETVALSHLTRFLAAAWAQLNQRIPVLGPATGERRVVASEGQGRLEEIDGTRVLVLKGRPEEMGHQQGVLLKQEVRDLMDRILYGVGVGSSFAKGRWFFGEIEAAQKRLAPFINPSYLSEMDALAQAIGAEPEEIHLANFFPELFHCSGFALFGRATVGGRLYHGRVLDYLRGFGLEQNAVVMVFQPDQGNAWVNVGYAGFVGSVTAMNEKQIAMGEMGGRGEGQWDGKPMAQLVREVMERANTLEEAVAIMRRGPRTCEYYYVISDGKTHRAVGIAATSTSFETIAPGQSHPLLPHPFPDAVLMSANERYEKLAERVKANYGKFDAAAARDLMTRPVCMPSNLHCALFAPDTLDFWVANADAEHVASAARYTHYNLRDLLQPPAPIRTQTAEARTP